MRFTLLQKLLARLRLGLIMGIIISVASFPVNYYLFAVKYKGCLQWGARPIKVPEDYPTIQGAVDAANMGDTILVAPGIYKENVVIKKTVSIAGKNKSATIIDGNGTKIVVHVLAHCVAISGFTIRNGRDGLLIFGGHETTISDNIITNNTGYGIHLLFSYFNILRGNNMTGNGLNFGVEGEDFFNNVDSSNFVDGKPIYYWINQADKQVPEDAGYVAIINSRNIIVKNINLSNNGEGVLFAHTTDSSIENVNISNNRYGIRLFYSDGNAIKMNKVLNSRYGIRLSQSRGNMISENEIRNNLYCFQADFSNDNIINNNTLSGNSKSVGMSVTYSRNNTFSDNVMTNNWSASRWFSSHSNTIYHNNFVNNTEQVYSIMSMNTWDDGYPSGGNYWSSYKGADMHGGLYQNEKGSDGTGDVPFVINEGNQDRYPLMGLFTKFSISWEEETYHIYTVTNSILSDFYFNQESKLVGFRITGPSNIRGFCRVTIPKKLLWCDTMEQWMVLVNGEPISYAAVENSNQAFIYFGYNQNANWAQIKGIHTISEPSEAVGPRLFILIIIIVSILICILGIALHRKRSKIPNYSTREARAPKVNIENREELSAASALRNLLDAGKIIVRTSMPC